MGPQTSRNEMKYIAFDGISVLGLERKLGICILYVELSGKGDVTREIGVDAAGSVVHRYPDRGCHHGLIDVKVEADETSTNDIAADAFEKLFAQSGKL